MKKFRYFLFFSFGLIFCRPNKLKVSPEKETPQTNGLCLTGVFGCDGENLDAKTSVNTKKIAWTILSSQKTQDQQWNGVGRYGNCTASLIDVGGLDESPAYILTNGHCVGKSLMGATGFIDENSADKEFHKNMTFSYYHDLLSSLIAYPDEVIVFGTMEHTDVGIVRMPENFGFYRSKFKAYRLSEDLPYNGQKVTVVGVPLTGIDSDHLGLHQSFCEIGEKVSLEEGPYSFSKSYRHTCSIVGGNSGSPIFDQKTGVIVGVVNTGVDDGTDDQSPCSLQRPCEVQSDHQKMINKKVNYGQSVSFLAHCFPDGIFNKDVVECSI